jgi:hypothetical protein
MKQLVLTLALAALVLPATALGKGPSEATISGPGGGGSSGSGGGALTITGCCSPETPTMQLAEHAGFFPAVFARQPDPMLDARPKGTLGPKYTIMYTVPGPNNETWKIRQDVYPYAESGPVTYMKPGQTVFRIPGGTRGGWFQADNRLKDTLVAAGLPRTASGAASDGNRVPTLALGAAAVLVLLIVGALVVRRRMRPTARMAGSPS